MNRIDEGGGPSVGIDPETLGTLITDAETACTDVETFYGAFNGRFTAEQVSTTNLAKVSQAAEWVRDQLPMLRRRQGLAQIAAQQSGVSFVTDGAGELPWDTQEEAATAGEEDAERLMDGIEPGDDIPAEVYELLEEHSDDPDYVQAFYERIGGEGINALRIGAVGDSAPGEYDESKLTPLSNSLGTASYRIDFTKGDWIKGMTRDGSMSKVLGPLVAYGTFNGNFLDAAVNDTLSGPGALASEQDATWVLNALARNPVAAANWYKDNQETADLFLQGHHVLMGHDSVPAAFANVMDAATIRVRRYDQALGEEATYALLERVGTKWGDNTAHPELQRWFGELVEHDMGDVYDSVTSPVEGYFSELRGSRDGVEAPAEWWGKFTEQAMRDPDVAANLSLQFENEYREHRDPLLGDENQEHPNANNFELAQTRHFSNWFTTRVVNVRDALGDEAEAWNENFGKAVDYIFSAADPVGLAKDITKDVIKAIANRDRPAYDVDTDWATSLQDNLYGDISAKYPPDGGVAEVTVDGLTWDGDPQFYAELYGGNFIGANGKIKPVDQMTEEEMLAYSHWLQDPAIQNMFWDDFSASLPQGVGDE